MSSRRPYLKLLLIVVFLSAAFFIPSFFPFPLFAAEKININTASIDQLDQLEGIGAVYAQRIIDGRPYSSLDDLLSVKGIGPAILQKIKDQGLACVDCGTAQENSSGEPPGPSDSPAPTSAAAPSAAPAPGYEYSQKIFINEFLPWPESGAKEWVELKNFDGTAINLAGWQIDDGNASTSPQVIPAGTTIAPGEFLVISFNKNVLNNDVDKIRLLWPDDQVVHTVAYAKATQGRSVARFDNGWLWTNQPTPGQANKRSFTETIETVSLASAPSNSSRVTTLEDIVAPAGAPSPASRSAGGAAFVQPTFTAESNNGSLAGLGAAEPNLLAAAGASTDSAKAGGYLALAGVIILALFSAGGLIYFRRQKTLPDLDGE